MTRRLAIALRVALVVPLWLAVTTADRLAGVDPPARLRTGLRWARTPTPSTHRGRWRVHRWGRTLTYGYRRGEWWVGARRDFQWCGLELNLFGLTLMIGDETMARTTRMRRTTTILGLGAFAVCTLACAWEVLQTINGIR